MQTEKVNTVAVRSSTNNTLQHLMAVVPEASQKQQYVSRLQLERAFALHSWYITMLLLPHTKLRQQIMVILISLTADRWCALPVLFLLSKALYSVKALRQQNVAAAAAAATVAAAPFSAGRAACRAGPAGARRLTGQSLC